MAFWQDWFCGRCDGSGAPLVEHASTGWPAVAPGSWEAVRARFTAGLERALALDAQDTGRPVEPPIDVPFLAGYTVRDIVEHLAAHNAHHLGQIVLLRQLLGSWPPPAGGFTW
jgi:uncharacterized damage-inducible protein DinB